MVSEVKEPEDRDLTERAHRKTSEVAALIKVDAGEPLHVPTYTRTEAYALCKREIHAEIPIFILQDIVEVVIPPIARRWAPVDKPALRPEAIPNLASKRLHVATPDEPDGGVEFGINGVTGHTVAQVASLAVQRDVKQLAGRGQKVPIAVR